jgi:hypothetical protein
MKNVSIHACTMLLKYVVYNTRRVHIYKCLVCFTVNPVDTFVRVHNINFAGATSSRVAWVSLRLAVEYLCSAWTPFLSKKGNSLRLGSATGAREAAAAEILVVWLAPVGVGAVLLG